MRFPFVSRDRYEEQQAELERTRVELSAERDRNFKLFNWTMWRIGGGVAFDTSLLPEQYQPKKTAAAAPAADSKTAETMRAVRAPGQSRRDISKFEVDQENFVHRNHRPISKEQVSLISELNKAADEGQKAAG